MIGVKHMSKHMSIVAKDISEIADNMWDKAISDAKNEIQSLSIQAKRLHQAVRIFEANKRDGIPWPSTDSNDNELKQ
jgi:hypothetical protein